MFSHCVEIFKIVELCNEVYKVLHNVDTASIAQVRKSPNRNYVVFTGIEMTEETVQFIYLGITYPDLTLNHACIDPTNSVDVDEELLYNSATSGKAIRRPLSNQLTVVAFDRMNDTCDDIYLRNHQTHNKFVKTLISNQANGLSLLRKSGSSNLTKVF